MVFLFKRLQKLTNKAYLLAFILSHFGTISALEKFALFLVWGFGNDLERQGTRR